MALVSELLPESPGWSVRLCRVPWRSYCLIPPWPGNSASDPSFAAAGAASRSKTTPRPQE